MTGGSEFGAEDKDCTPMLAAQVPVGWQRTIEGGEVAYISPSGSILFSVEEVRKYLLTDGACKCGLECPLVIHKVFNFDPGVIVRQRCQQPGNAKEDMTKLCNHRRKVVAMAALCRSMQASQLPLTTHGTGSKICTMESRDPRGGLLGAREEGGYCTYSPRLRLSVQPKLNNNPSPTKTNSSPKLSISFPHNGTLPTSRSGFTSRPSPELILLSRKLPLLSPGHSPFSCYEALQWYPRPPTAKNLLQNQRPTHTTKPPGSPQLGLHTHAYSLNTSLSFSSSSCPGALGLGHTGLNLQQRGGGSVTSPAPFSCSPSSSGSLDCLSSHQHARNSSVSSSLSEQGVGMNPPPPSHPTSPKSHLEGMLRRYKESGCTSANSNNPLQHRSNQSNFQVPQNLILSPFTSEKKNGQPELALAANANANASFFSLPLNQQKPHQHASSFPASSLLSAAAKAQLASQKSQTKSNSGNAHFSASSAMGVGKEAQQSKVLFSTLHSSVPYIASSPTMTTLLLPHSSTSRAPHPLPITLLDKVSHQKRQRRSSTVLSMLKESQLNSLRATKEPGTTWHSHSLSSTSALLHPQPGNHLQHHHPFVFEPNSALGLHKQPDVQENKRTGVAANSSTSPPTQPLSALLHLLSVQSTQASATQTGPSPGPNPTTRQGHVQPFLLGLPITPPSQFQAQPPPNLLTSHQKPQSFAPTQEGPTHPPSPPLMGVAIEMDGNLTNPKLDQNPSPILVLSQQHMSVSQDMGSQIVGLLGQLSSLPSSISLGEKSSEPRMGESGPEETSGTSHQGQSSSTAGTWALDPQESPETRLPGSPSPVLAPPPVDSSDHLQLAESFSFTNQDQLLQLLSDNSGLPSPFLGSLPIGLWIGGGQALLPPEQHPCLLNQTSQLNILHSMLGAQGDLPVNLLSLLNPPPPPPVSAPGAKQAGELVEKPGLQALLMASLLLSQQQAAAMLPLAGLDLLLQQQHNFLPLPDGICLEKAARLSDLGPVLLEALQTLALQGEGALQALQSLLFPPPTFLSLSPALLATALGPPDPPPASQQPLTPHPSQAPTQVTLSSSSMGSTSVSCSPLMPSFAPYVADAMTAKGNFLPPQLLTPLLAAGVLGDLAAHGNVNSVHSLMEAEPLLFPPLQATALAMPPIQGQAAGLNPLACLFNNLQANMGLALTMGGEKPMGMHETTSPTSQDDILSSQLAQDPVRNPAHALGGLLDPYSSFMNTIYNSFLQVNGKSPEGVSGQVGRGTQSPLPNSYSRHPHTLPPQKSAPPSLSPRCACSLRNPDLFHLSMEAAQSPARGTPKLSDESSPTHPYSKPGDTQERSEPPVPPAFPEEAKTDCFTIYPYSNGLLSKAEVQAQPQANHSPVEGVKDTGEDHMGPEDTQEGRVPTVRTGGVRRGRKRKQVLPRGSDSSRDMDIKVTEEARATMVLQKPERSMKSKRRVFR